MGVLIAIFLVLYIILVLIGQEPPPKCRQVPTLVWVVNKRNK